MKHSSAQKQAKDHARHANQNNRQTGGIPILLAILMLFGLLIVITLIAAVSSSSISTMATGGGSSSGDPSGMLNPDDQTALDTSLMQLPTPGNCLIYFWKVEPQFAQAVRAGAGRLMIDPNWLMAVMEFESNLSPSKVNPDSQATGLIQFMPDTAANMGTSVGALRGMSRMQQWTYVERYFRDGVRAFGRPKALTDAYMIVLNPANVRTGEADIMRTQRRGRIFYWTGTPAPRRGKCLAGNAYYCQNAGLDFAPRNGAITKFEAGSVVRQRYQRGYAGCIGRF